MSRMYVFVVMCIGWSLYWATEALAMLKPEFEVMGEREGVSFAERVLEFDEKLAQTTLTVPAGFRIINPFQGAQSEAVKASVRGFYTKYFNDSHPRRIIFGSSPARRGSALSGIPFEDQRSLQIGDGHAMSGASDFLYEVMERYGGREKFYFDFYMSFVCPLGIVKTKGAGGEVNCNYYEDKRLQKVLAPFILETISDQLTFGIDKSVCYCIGSGENYSFLSKLNTKHHFFDKIIPLEHPRFIMQYHPREKDSFIEKYITAFTGL